MPSGAGTNNGTTSRDANSIIHKRSVLKIINWKNIDRINKEWAIWWYLPEILLNDLHNMNIIFDNNWDISKLKNPIHQLKEFYSVFTNFNLMIDFDLKLPIFGQKLNARDAWSYIVIKHANSNLVFINKLFNKLLIILLINLNNFWV